MMSMDRRFFVGLTCGVATMPFAAPSRVLAGEPELELELRRYLKEIVDNGWVAGAAVELLRPNRPPLRLFHGLADREAGTPVASDTIYRIYSMTKPVTAAAAMALVEKGRLRLDQPIADFLPEFAAPRVFVSFDGDQAITEPVKRPITVRHLLTHTSGLSESFNKGLEPTAAIYERIGLKAGQFDPGLNIATLDDYAKVLATIPLAFQPGTRWLYSSSLDLAGRVIEVAAGKPYDDYLSETILGPLGMIDTGFALPAAKQPRLAALYAAGQDGASIRVPPPLIPKWGAAKVIPMGGSGLFSTMDDYARFVQMLLGKGAFEGRRILREESVAQMMTNQLPSAMGDTPLSAAARFGLGGEVAGLGFGLGGSVMLDPARAGGVGHVGEYAWGGAASTTFWADPVKEIGVVLMTQKLPSGVHPLRDNLRRAVYRSLG